MRTLSGALDDGLISPVLAQLWCKQNNLPSPYLAAFRRQVSVISLLFGMLCISNGYWFSNAKGYSHPFSYLLLAMGTMGMIGFFAGLSAWITKSEKADITFLRDCTQLNHFLTAPGYYGKEELQKHVRNSLLRFASNLLKDEIGEGRGSSEAEKSREIFKNAHAIMLRFGLANEQWDEYFAEAQNPQGSK